jgi:predicted P-loop ATPase
MDINQKFTSCLNIVNTGIQAGEIKEDQLAISLINSCAKEGMKLEEISDQFVSQLDYSETDALNIVNDYFQSFQDIPAQTTLPEEATNIHKIESFLTQHYDVRFNVVMGRPEIRLKSVQQFKVLTDRIFHSVLRHINKSTIKCSDKQLKSILHSDFLNSYNPFVDYFDHLPEWDGETDYIAQLSKTVRTTDNKTWRWYFEKWIVTVVASALKDKVINQTMLVMVGNQGIGKTTWIMNLVPKQLEQYAYSGIIDPKNKDTILLLAESLIIIVDELEYLSKNQMGELKELITKSAIRLRRAYGHYNDSFIHRASFICSVNSINFLTDTTGSRRFLISEVVSIEKDPDINLDNVFGQAYALYKNNFQYWFDLEEHKIVSETNEQYATFTMEEELLLKYLSPTEKFEEAQFYMTATEIVRYLESASGTRLRNNSNVTLGKYLVKFDFKKGKDKGLYKYALQLKIT